MPRRLLVLLLLGTLLALPLAAARADAGDESPDSKLGVLLAMACGGSLRVARIAPVPWAGVALVVCLATLLEGAGTGDGGSPPPASDPLSQP